MTSILGFSKVVVSQIYQLLDFALKSPTKTIKKIIFVKISYRVS